MLFTEFSVSWESAPCRALSWCLPSGNLVRRAKRSRVPAVQGRQSSVTATKSVHWDTDEGRLSFEWQVLFNSLSSPGKWGADKGKTWGAEAACWAGELRSWPSAPALNGCVAVHSLQRAGGLSTSLLSLPPAVSSAMSLMSTASTGVQPPSARAAPPGVMSRALLLLWPVVVFSASLFLLFLFSSGFSYIGSWKSVCDREVETLIDI